MSKVTICRGRDMMAMEIWADKQSALVVDTEELREMLGRCTDKLILSIRDNIMIKCLRAGRNVILIGEFNLIEQIERIDEILDAQGKIDGVKYPYKVKDIE